VIRLRQDGSAAPQAGGAATRRRDCLWLLVIGITVVAVVRVLIVLGLTGPGRRRGAFGYLRERHADRSRAPESVDVT
jgi:hypothetical protein